MRSLVRSVLSIYMAWLSCTFAYAADQNKFDSGVRLYRQKKYREALEKFTSVTQVDSRNSSAFLYQAYCRHLLGDIAGATILYQHVVKYFPRTEAGQLAARFFANSGSVTPRTNAAKNIFTEKSDTGDNADKEAPTNVSSLVTVVRPRADRPSVSTSTLNTIRAAVDRLPNSVKTILWQNDIKIFITPTVEDYEPGVKYQEARGYEGGTYKSCPAFYSNGKVVLAEHTLDEGDETVNAAFSHQEMLNSLFHETGHALDDCLQDISKCEEFKHAYLLDSARIEPATAHRLRYYLQKSTTGQGECCAELIGSLLGLRESHTNDIMASFPLTLKFLRAKLQI